MGVIEVAADVFAHITCDSTPFPGSIEARITNKSDKPVTVTLWAFAIGTSVSHVVASSPQITIDASSEILAAIQISGRAPFGSYIICGTVTEPGQGVNVPIAPLEPNDFHWIGDDAPADVRAAGASALNDQQEYTSRPIYSPEYTGEQCYRVYVLLEGCRLDYPQPIQGGLLNPLPFGMSCESEIAAINRLAEKGAFELDAGIDRGWQSEHPLILATFSRVYAPNPGAAYEAVSQRLNVITGVLAMVRMASSRVAAAVVETDNGGPCFVLPRRNYMGNLVPGMVSGESSRQLDAFVAAAVKDPWIDLIVHMYGEALSERNPLFRTVRLWSVIEACAKRRPLPGFDSTLRDAKEKLYEIDGEIVKGKDFAKVCYYVQEIAGGKLWGRVEPSVSNCALLRKAYLVRNIGAHEGVLNETGLSAEAKASVELIFATGGTTGLQILIQYALNASRNEALRTP